MPKALKRLLNNKRGQVPTTDIVGTIVNGIRSFISWFLSTAPKPLLFALFLVFILLLGNLLVPLLLNGFGYHCDTHGTVWKVSGLNIFANFDILRHKPDIEEANTQNIPLLCGGSGQVEGTKVIYCTDCPVNNETFKLVDQFCVGDGYKPVAYSSFLQKLNCNWFGCAPPDGYFYNFSLDKFQCYEEFCQNKTLEDYNAKIYEIEGATPAYAYINGSYDYRNLLYMKCSVANPVNIRLTLYGIDIFAYQLWVTLAVLGVLMYFYNHFRK